MITYIVLAVWLIVFSYTDIRHKRIPNVLVVFMSLTGIALNLLSQFDVDDNISLNVPIIHVHMCMLNTCDIKSVLAGVLIPLILLPLWLIKALGAGDIKLMMATGLFVGSDIVVVLLYSFIAGAVIGVIMLIRSGKLISRLTSVLQYSFVLVNAKKTVVYEHGTDSKDATVIPFGICIFIGTIVYIVMTVL